MITGCRRTGAPWRLAMAAALAMLAATRAQIRWDVLSTTGPSPRWGHGLAYDVARRRTVLFGGSDAAGAICIGPAFPNCQFSLGGGVLPETWEWDGRTWTQFFPAFVPPASLLPGQPNPAPWTRLLTYDAARAVSVMLVPAPQSSLNLILWQWNGITWSSITLASPVVSFFPTAAAFDAARGVTVWFDGTDIVEWDGSVLIGRGPFAAGIIAAAFDEARGRVVGVSQQGPSMLTWEWDGASLQLRSTPVAPPVRQTTTFAYDARRQVVVMHGGQSPVWIQLDDLWEWDGNAWTQRSASSAPGARSYHAMAYHRSCDHLLVFGGRLLTTLFSLQCPCPWPGCTIPLPCFDSVSQPYGDLLRCAASGPGQANGAAAGLVLGGCFGRDAVPGPIPAALPGGGPVSLDWSGPPFQPFLLFTGPLNPAAWNAGCAGWVDIGTPPAFLDLLPVFNGLANPVFTLDASGRAQELVLVPALPPGPLLDIQGAVLQPAGAACPFVATAAFSVAIE